MEIYVTLRDSDQPQSFVIGAFSTEDRAQAACQAEVNDNAEAWGTPAASWNGRKPKPKPQAVTHTPLYWSTLTYRSREAEK